MTFYDDLVAAGDRDAASLVGVEHRGDRAMVTLDDPHTRNVLSAAMVRQLRSALERLAGDRAIRAIARLIARSDTAFIAALNGPAAGVGLAWALTCDLAIASERAKIVPAFGRLGLLPRLAPRGRSPGRSATRARLPATRTASTWTHSARSNSGSFRRSSPATTCSPPPTAGATGSRRSRCMRSR